MRLSSREINEQAAVWAFKVDSGPLSAEEQAALDLWLAADVRHPGALGRTVAYLAQLDRLSALGAGALKKTISDQQTGWTRRRLIAASAGISGLAAAGIVLGIMIQSGSQAENFATKIGESCSVTLSDGSTIMLNTDTSLSVEFTEQRRNIHLAHGEAVFHVAKDKARPFVVNAGEAQILAVGTVFNVQRLPKRPVQVLVQEGVVEVSQPDVPAIAPIRAAAGTQSTVQPRKLIATRTVAPRQIEVDLAWQHGRLEFDSTTLGAAAEEFARYSRTKLTVDPAVSDRTITGSFASNDPVAFARSVTAVLDLRYEVADNEIRISR